MVSTGQCIALAHGSKEAIRACLDARPQDDQYGYVPSISLGAVFVVVFGISGLAHLGQLVYARRYWWMACMVVGNIRESPAHVLAPFVNPAELGERYKPCERTGAGGKTHDSQTDFSFCSLAVEILGWAGRLWAHYAPLSFSAYVMQICTLIIAPTFMSAALYWAGGLIISHLDPSRSWLSGNWFKAIFIVADVVSLVIQAIGGGMAGSAVGANPKPDQLRTGSNIMLAGIVIQLAVMVFYVAYMAVWAFLARRTLKRAGGRIQLMLLALFASSLGIIIRGCYRTPELHEGFKGWIATQQIWMLFDAIPIAFSTFVLNVIHPHWFLVYPHNLDSVYLSDKPTSSSSPAQTATRNGSDTTVAQGLQQSIVKGEKVAQQV
ncbi:putative RTA1 domain protein [Rhodotorula toruloides]|uniref:Putative RTA1 domain protein n=1 Tax=Rhodotorula toruloides TaxID=5286 RepID=A0A2S9ZWB2_RHOTO|nr:putative RTA1 domain protein [Rhodotorula toruloides]